MIGSLFGMPAADLAELWAPQMGGALVKGGVLLLVIGGLAFLLRGAAAATRHLLWTLGIKLKKFLADPERQQKQSRHLEIVKIKPC